MDNNETRKVARLKPVSSDPGVGQYYDKAHGDGKLESAEIKWEPDSIFTREDVREMIDAANIGLKDRILHNFGAKWMTGAGIVGHDYAIELLTKVLDELNIK